MEHRRLELLTPTLPVLCATSCANAPRTKDILSQKKKFVKGVSKIFLDEKPGEELLNRLLILNSN